MAKGKRDLLQLANSIYVPCEVDTLALGRWVEFIVNGNIVGEPSTTRNV